MKVFILIIVFIIVFGIVFVSVVLLDIVIKNKFVMVCKVIQSGNKFELLKVMCQYCLSYDKVISDLCCNGMLVIVFVE